MTRVALPYAEGCVGLTDAMLSHPRICGFCYTQLTDIEQEQNGLFSYDRTKKFEDTVYDRIREVNRRAAEIEKTDFSRQRSLMKTVDCPTELLCAKGFALGTPLEPVCKASLLGSAQPRL